MNHLTDLVEGIRAKYSQYFENPLKEAPKPPYSRDFKQIPVQKSSMDRVPVYEVTQHVYEELALYCSYEEEALHGILERGIEAIAWYAPFHVYLDWGIHIDLHKLMGLTCHVYKRLPPGVSLRAVFRTNDPLFPVCRVVVEVILQHEYFHFLTEYIATMLETLYTKQIYLPYFQSTMSSPLGYDPDEEAIANALGIASIRHRRKLVELFESLFSRSPRGYRDYQKYLTNEDTLDVPKVRRFLSSKFIGASPSDPLLPTPFEMPGKHLLPAIPIYRYAKSRTLCYYFDFLLKSIIESIIRRYS